MLSDSVQDSRTCFDFFAKKGRCFLGRFDSRRFGREPSWARFLASSRKFAALRSWEMQLDSVVQWHLKLNTGIMLVTCNYATALHGIFKQRESIPIFSRGRKQTIMESQYGTGEELWGQVGHRMGYGWQPPQPPMLLLSWRNSINGDTFPFFLATNGEVDPLVLAWWGRAEFAYLIAQMAAAAGMLSQDSFVICSSRHSGAVEYPESPCLGVGHWSMTLFSQIHS